MSAEEIARRQSRGGWAEDAYLQRTSPPFGPLNTWSNVAYAAGGVVIIALSPLSEAPIVGTTMCMLGIGSGLYHAYKTKGTNDLDWAGMYAAMTALTVHGLVPGAPGIALGTVSAATVLTLMFSFEDKRFDWHMGGLFVLSSLPVWIEGSLLHAAVATGTFALAYTFQRLDHAHVKAVGKFGHAIWHVLAATAMAVLYFGRS